jgi:hypothetical protein
MSTKTLAEIEDLATFLASASYAVDIRPLGRFSRVLLAENPYALVACVETETWSGLTEVVSDLQAELTHLARADASPKRWDLYVVVHVRAGELRSVDGVLIEQIESDTRFARKFVRVNMLRDPDVLDRALRPFLPLRAPMPLSVPNPMEVLRSELVDHGLDEALVEFVFDSFESTGEVRTP